MCRDPSLTGLQDSQQDATDWGHEDGREIGRESVEGTRRQRQNFLLNSFMYQDEIEMRASALNLRQGTQIKGT